ncbi:beta-1,3-glucan-binding protein-like [Ctenocephalides felis]|uniref:beta-1,3-glucan-binding protein-like n=1 Tax=Ctenocephalides felis TaxID=7515 RepID=UPI000E6E1D3D|nr:beta-1,3-glucan-binding protein-like [Ctenocephalides felis]
MVYTIHNYWTVFDYRNQLKAGDIINYEYTGHKWTEIGFKSGWKEWYITEDAFAHCLPSLTTLSKQQRICKGKLIFEDNFTMPELDLTKWQHDCYIPSQAMDNEFVSYQGLPKNIYIEKDILVVKPTLIEDKNYIENGVLDLEEICNCKPTYYGECNKKAISYNILPPVMSASIRSKFSFKYGKIQIHAKLPKGNWLYPILQLEPKDYNHGPGYASGAIRIAFARGNNILVSRQSGYDYGNKELSCGLIFKDIHPIRNITARRYQRTQSKPWSEYFETYEVEWAPSHMLFSIGNRRYGLILPPSRNFQDETERDVTYGESWEKFMPIFDEQMVIRIGVGAGGMTDFPDNTLSSSFSDLLSPKPWRNLEPKAMLGFWQDRENWKKTWTDSKLEIRSVKVWAL